MYCTTISDVACPATDLKFASERKDAETSTQINDVSFSCMAYAADAVRVSVLPSERRESRVGPAFFGFCERPE